MVLSVIAVWGVVGFCFFAGLMPDIPPAKINLWRVLLVSIPFGPLAFASAAVLLLVRPWLEISNLHSALVKKIRRWVRA